MGKKYNYPSHTAPRVYQAVYRNKSGQEIRHTRSSSVLTAIRNVPKNCTHHKAVAEVEVFHILERHKHPEALVFVRRTPKRLEFETSILRPHLP